MNQQWSEQEPVGTVVRPVTSRYRWIICALLFFATTINYVDRQIIGVLKPMLQSELGWNERDYADIVFWFQAAYAIGLLLAGRAVDRMGTRIGYAAAVALWSAAAAAHAFVGTVAGFSAVRFLLGLGEAGNFPAAVKSVAEWFPKRERALATGILNAGANVGAIATPLVVPIIVLSFGWRAAFLLTGAAGLVWLAVWLLLFRAPAAHRSVSAAELLLIGSDPPTPDRPVTWTALFRERATWAFLTAKFLTDPVWYLFLFWLPDFFARNHGLDLKTFGPPLVAVYLLADAGSIGGGWLSSRLLSRGWTVARGRRAAMLACALLATPIVFAGGADSLWAATALIGLAAAAHQGWSTNLFTIVSDTLPQRSVASVIGIGGAAGAVGGMLMAKYVGHVLDTLGDYRAIFLWAGCAYLVALGGIRLILGPAASD